MTLGIQRWEQGNCVCITKVEAGTFGRQPTTQQLVERTFLRHLQQQVMGRAQKSSDREFSGDSEEERSIGEQQGVSPVDRESEIASSMVAAAAAQLFCWSCHQHMQPPATSSAHGTTQRLVPIKAPGAVTTSLTTPVMLFILFGWGGRGTLISSDRIFVACLSVSRPRLCAAFVRPVTDLSARRSACRQVIMSKETAGLLPSRMLILGDRWYTHPQFTSVEFRAGLQSNRVLDNSGGNTVLPMTPDPYRHVPWLPACPTLLGLFFPWSLNNLSF